MLYNIDFSLIWQCLVAFFAPAAWIGAIIILLAWLIRWGIRMIMSGKV